MAATQFIVAVYDKIWDLLEAHAPFTDAVRVGNRLDWTLGRAVAKRYALAAGKAPGDYPEFSLELGGGQDEWFGDGHYGMRSPATAPASIIWTEVLRQDYVINIITDEKRITSEQLVYLEAMTAIRKGGPRLGLAYVHHVGGKTTPVTTERTVEATDETANAMRPVTRITIPVIMKFQGSEMLT